MFTTIGCRHTLPVAASVGPWTFGWDALVAIGTLALAAVTFALVLVTKRSVDAAKDEIGIERRRIEAGQWPRVFPMPLDRWVASRESYSGGQSSRVLPIKNGGTGVALNVHGQLDFTGQGGPVVELVNTSLGANDTIDIVLDWPTPEAGIYWQGEGLIGDWSDCTGWLDYEGVGGESWRTSFRISTEGDRGFRRVRIGTTEMTRRADGTVLSGDAAVKADNWYVRPDPLGP